MYSIEPKKSFNVSVKLARNGIHNSSQSSYYNNDNFTEVVKEVIRTFRLFKGEEIMKVVITKN